MTSEAKPLIDEYTTYRRTNVAEMRPWSEGTDMDGVSVSEADRDNGSPKVGDMIARNPANHADKWLVAADYFAENFEAALSRIEAEGDSIATLTAQLAAARDEVRAADVVKQDLAMLVRRMASKLPGQIQLRVQAMDYLARNGLQGSPLRAALTTESEE